MLVVAMLAELHFRTGADERLQADFALHARATASAACAPPPHMIRRQKRAQLGRPRASPRWQRRHSTRRSLHFAPQITACSATHLYCERGLVLLQLAACRFQGAAGGRHARSCVLLRAAFAPLAAVSAFAWFLARDIAVFCVCSASAACVAASHWFATANADMRRT